MLLVNALINAIQYGEHPILQYILDQLVSVSFLYARISLKPTFFSAPMGDGFPNAEWEAPLAQPLKAQMTRLQIFLARELGGWPLYTIIIALGQVRKVFLIMFSSAHTPFIDVVRHKFPDNPSKRA